MYLSEPMSDNQPLMRYLTHEKFLRLLDPKSAFDTWRFIDPPPTGTVVWKAPFPTEYGSLWMSLPNAFDDKDEGMFPALNNSDEAFCYEAARYLGLSPDEAIKRKELFLERNPAALRDGIRARTQLCGVSCWYQDSQESSRMWREYVPDGTGVVVKTTLGQFEEALGWIKPQYNRFVSPVFATINYVDRNDFFLVNDGYYHLLTIKGDGFRHEREVRLIAKSPALVQATKNNANPSYEELTTFVATAGKGFNVLIDLKRLMTEIRVHPSANANYLMSIQEKVEKKGISPEIVKLSELNCTDK